MFGRLTNVRIKAAEDAFEQDRLDEAFEIAVSPDLSSFARIHELRRKLSSSLLKTGQDLMMDRQFNNARNAFVRAAQLEPDEPRIGDWIRRADEAIESEQAARHQRTVAHREARERMEAGSLNGAAAVLRNAPATDVDGMALNDEIARRAEKAADLMAAAQKAVSEHRLQSAVENLTSVRKLNARQEGLSALESAVVRKLADTASNAFHDGRLDRAAADVQLMQSLGDYSAERRDIEAAINLAARAASALQSSEYAEADVLLGRLVKISPKAKWAADARKRLRNMDDNRRALFEGPLGLAASIGNTPVRRSTPIDETMPAAQAAPPPPLPPANNPNVQDRFAGAGRLPRRMLLRIDGVGSFLLIRGDRITIGRAGPGAPSDIQLLSDLSERHADIVRAGEDYFVVSQSGVELAGNATDHALLQDGDRIRLSRRVRLTFSRPSLKSTAASLELGEGVRMPTECRRIILWSGPVLMGATKECHVRLASTLGQFVLVERGGRLFFKAMRGDAGRNIELGEQITIGELSFRITDWNASVGTHGSAVS